jgi:hypothetical protein
MAVTRTATVPNPGGVKVAVGSGQYLHFILDAGGPKPIFSFESNVKSVLYQAADFPGDPMQTYEWDHLKNPSDIQQLELLEVLLTFFTNADYTYTVKVCDAGGTLSTALQVKFNGAPTDLPSSESFRVVLI